MKKAFTLVELLVVIGILGILSAVLIGSLSSGTESARAAKCLTNMKNLASACQTYGMASGHYPLAGSVERLTIDDSRGVRNIQERYSELPGWISWYSAGAYASKPNSHVANAGWFISAYSQDEEANLYCLTNGALWKYLSGNRGVYVCPDHKIAAGSLPPFFTYLMNEAFGWDDSEGQDDPKGENYHGKRYADLARADRILLFAEMQWKSGIASDPIVSEGAGTTCDCTLQHSKSEMIGFNHTSGKREKVAHLVFADGHTEKLRLPKGGMGNSEIAELTKLLCKGKDIELVGSRYQELK